MRPLKITLLLLSTLTVMAGATIAPSLPQMAEVFKETPNALFLSKLILTIPALFIAITGPFAGQILDKYGRLKLLYVVLVLYAVAGTSGYVLNNLYLILIGRALLGVAVGGVMTTAVTLAGDYFVGEERTAFLGVQSAFMALGGVIFVSVGGILADISWRMPFLIYLFSLLMLPLVIRYLYEPKGLSSDSANGNLAEEAGPSESPRSTIILVYAIALLGMALFYMLPVQVPFILGEFEGGSNSATGVAIALAIGCASISAFSYPKVRKYLATSQVYTLQFVLMAVGFVIISQATNIMVATIGMVVSGFGAGFMMPNTNLWLISLTRLENRGRLMGGLTMAIFIGQFLSPILVYPMDKYFSLEFAFLAGAVTMLIMALGFWLAKSWIDPEPT